MNHDFSFMLQNALEFARLDGDEYARMCAMLEALPLTLSTADHVSGVLGKFSTCNEGKEEEGAGAFALYAFYLFANKGKKFVSDIVEQTIAELRSATENREELSGTLDSLRPRLDKLAGFDNIITSLRASLLLAARPLLFSEAQVICDLRPVMRNAAHSEPVLLVMNTLKLDYVDDDSIKTMHLAIDEQDIAELIAQLSSALSRAESLKESFRSAKCRVFE